MREELAKEGFGVLTEIDVQATLEQKLGVKGEPYLPCNVVVRTDDGAVRVAAMEPDAAMRLAGNSDLAPLAAEARDRLKRALSQI